MCLPPDGKRKSLSHRLCPPGLPGRRSRAAQALVAPAGAKLPRLTIIMAGLVFLARALPFVDRHTVEERGNGPCGGRPLRRLRATPPLSGEARPKCRLRRLAVGLLRSPLGERFLAAACRPLPSGRGF